MFTFALNRLRENIVKIEKVRIVERQIGQYCGRIIEKSEKSKSLPMRAKFCMKTPEKFEKLENLGFGMASTMDQCLKSQKNWKACMICSKK